METPLVDVVRAWEAQFVEDDYDTVSNKYFGELRATRKIASDPSGWLDTYSRVQDQFPVR